MSARTPESHFTRRRLHAHVGNLIDKLIEIGIVPVEAWIYGSYVKGGVKSTSDIDLAIWISSEDEIKLETPQCISLITAFHPVHIKWFESELDVDPFTFEVRRTGVKLFPLQPVVTRVT